MIKREAKGGITVFLSLVILLVLAVITTVIEAARVDISEVYAERALQIAMESVFTKYCHPLFEDYHMFFLEDNKEREEEIKKYMQYTFEPNNQIYLLGSNIQISNWNLYNISTTEVKIEELTNAVDYQGNIFVNQAVEYMKYNTQTQVLKKVLEGLNIIKESQNTSVVVNEKLQAEESLAEMNLQMGEIIEKIEGVAYGENGINYTKDGRIQTKDFFVKQLIVKEITSETVGVNNEVIWKSLKDSYINPLDSLEKIENNINKYVKSEEDDKKADLYAVVMKEKDLLISQVNGVRKKIKEVFQLLPELKEKQALAEKEVEKFDKVLAEKKNEMEERVYQGLEEDLNYMNDYCGRGNQNNKEDSLFSQLIKMEEVLEKNDTILEKAVSLEGASMEELGQSIELLKTEFQCYQVKSLTFNYCDLITDSEVDNPIDSVENLVSNGLLTLVMKDSDDISDKSLLVSDNLFQQYGMKTGKTEEKEIEYGTIIRNSKKEGYSSEITEMFSTYGENEIINDQLYDGANKMAESLLLGEYFNKHYKNYRNDETKLITRDTALDYEQEYLIIGKSKDKENIEGIMNRILGIRTILNFLTLVSDSSKGELAYITAAALVGFTGLEPLVRITKMLILVVWAFEEALVDTGALFQGKKVPIWKGGKDIMIQYPELLTVNKALIQCKINMVEEKHSSLFSIGYEEYLKIFFYMSKREKTIFRAMDLIENNMQLTYYKDFTMKNCIYGMFLSCEWKIPKKFIQLPFVKGVLGEDKSGWKIKKSMEYAY